MTKQTRKSGKPDSLRSELESEIMYMKTFLFLIGLLLVYFLIATFTLEKENTQLKEQNSQFQQIYITEHSISFWGNATGEWRNYLYIFENKTTKFYINGEFVSNIDLNIKGLRGYSDDLLSTGNCKEMGR